MEKDSLNIGTQIITEIDKTDVNKCVCVIMVIFTLVVVISILLFAHRKSKRMKKKIKLLSESKIDMRNVINSSFLAKPLYDEIKGKCHPDNFSNNSELFEKATIIFSLIVNNKHNYNTLLALKERAEKELNINFNKDE